LRREWEELFDTSPDLSGADIDISRFIRSGEELDVLVFWRQIPEAGPLEDWEPGRDELCPLSFLKARDWLGKEKAGVAWVWDWLDGQWQRATERNIYPGRIVLVDAAAGGYSELAGWSKAHAGPVPLALGAKSSLVARADGSQSRDDISVSAWKTIATHGKETALLAEALARSLGLPDELTSLVGVAGMWHDVGKAHACFQGSMRLPDRPARQDLAKAPGVAWSKAWRYEAVDVPSDQRPGLRHELASVLAMFAALQKAAPGHPALSPKAWEFTGAAKPEPESTQGEPGMWVSQLAEIGSSLAFNLMAYLVASHHGKVRMRMQAHAKDQRYRDRDGRGLPICGVREGDRLAAVMGDGERPLVGELELSLELARLGLSDKTGPSWTERTLGLLAHYGPGPLALMEAVLRAADIRASQLDTADPLLPQEVRL
jgi:CRISPR-associated endonuclease/helicase Cas3